MLRTTSVVLVGAAVSFLAACATEPTLTSEPPPVVVCTMEGRFGVAVIVRDSMTGAGKAREVAALLRSGPYVEPARSLNDSTLAGAIERPGTYALELSADGYLDWRTQDIVVTQSSGACPKVQTTLVRANLQMR